jgi:GMP synthase (glutamine-hydrolysing)
MALELGGDVMRTPKREYGPAVLSIAQGDYLLTGLGTEQPVWMSHGDSITRLPAGFTATAHTDATPFAGLADPSRNLFGIQFHPEVVHTPRGRDVLANFVLGIAAAKAEWTSANFIESTVERIRERVGAHAVATGSEGRVICALSGGVDSAVAAALVHRAVGDRLTCIYVDHGLMRKRESELLRDTFEANLGMRLVMVDARDRFLARLAGVEDPEQKRIIIGDEFIHI